MDAPSKESTLACCVAYRLGPLDMKGVSLEMWITLAHGSLSASSGITSLRASAAVPGTRSCTGRVRVNSLVK